MKPKKLSGFAQEQPLTVETALPLIQLSVPLEEKETRKGGDRNVILSRHGDAEPGWWRKQKKNENEKINTKLHWIFRLCPDHTIHHEQYCPLSITQDRFVSVSNHADAFCWLTYSRRCRIEQFGCCATSPQTAETTTDSTDDVQMSDVTTECAALRTWGKRI